MRNRRIVTGHDQAGKSVFLQDGPSPRTSEFKSVPGFSVVLLWDTQPGSSVPAPAHDAAVAARSFLPLAGGTSVQLVQFPPDSVMMSASFNPEAAGEEYMRTLPGLAEKFEPEHPGMHTTDSVDYGVLLEGELCLELDDGETRFLRPHDVVVQNGTRHAWRNRSDKPATMLFVLVGALRS